MAQVQLGHRPAPGRLRHARQGDCRPGKQRAAPFRHQTEHSRFTGASSISARRNRRRQSYRKKMKTSALFLLVIFVGFAALRAEDRPPLEVKNKSSFQMESGRNPFWPIGFKPTAQMTNLNAGRSGLDVPLSAFLL